MVKRKIIWSNRAKIKLFQILEFYTERNKSAAYSKKFYNKFNKELSLLLKQTEIGIQTDIDFVRGLIVDEIISDKVIIHSVWDCRQNPDELVIKR